MVKVTGKKLRRALHFDFHTSPGVKGILSGFDAEKFADQLASAHIEYINIAARCNMGFSYYNTKIGKKYEGLGDRDLIAEVTTACHKRDIGVSVYFNLGLDHEIAADHPEWLKVDKEGRIHGEDKWDNFFRQMCVNSPYGEHFLGEIREACGYDIDGIFCDCFRLTACYCPHCAAKMEAEGVDISDDAAVMDFANKTRFAFLDAVRGVMREKSDELKFYVNGMSWTSGTQTHAEVECLTSDPQWGYDFFDSVSAYTRTLYEDRVYMSGRFQNSWGDLGGVKTLASMQNDLYDALMNSFGISFGDHLHPVSGFENEVCRRIKAVMEEKLIYEPYTENSENVVEVGVLIHSLDVSARLPLYTKGAARMLKELKIPFNVYDENGSFEDVRLLIVCESDVFDDTLCKRLCNYVREGGKVIFVGPAIDLGKKIGLLEHTALVGEDKSDNAYFTLPDNDMRWAMYSPSRLIKNVSGCEVSRYVSGVLNFTWDGRQATFYRPQGELTEYSTAIAGDSTACICFNIFEAYAESFLVEQREVLRMVIDKLLPDRLIESKDMPKTAAVSITQNATARVLHVKATYAEHKMKRGIIEEHVYMKSATVSVRGEHDVYVLPEMKHVDCTIENGRTSFETGDILGYRAFLLK